MERSSRSFKEFKELVFRIPSRFVGLDSAVSQSLKRIKQFATPEHNFSFLNSSNS
jgi:hypothetical protein